ncbi:uncharacterized protein VNE69_10074 [Vairimorpha necatrix]|uniref:Uncharacterized protein n=1 Tax=Vairimorpha necatrix TaxID=6039 RepID=A0AAX4JG14_9MICR
MNLLDIFAYYIKITEGSGEKHVHIITNESNEKTNASFNNGIERNTQTNAQQFKNTDSDKNNAELKSILKEQSQNKKVAHQKNKKSVTFHKFTKQSTSHETNYNLTVDQSGSDSSSQSFAKEIKDENVDYKD